MVEDVGLDELPVLRPFEGEDVAPRCVNRHIVRQTDRRGHRVPSDVPRDLLVDAAQLHDFFDVSEDRAVLGHGKYLAAFAYSFILFIDYFRNVEQLHLRQNRRFLARDMNPLVIVEIGADIIFRQVVQLTIGQAREAAEHEQVAHEFMFGFLETHIHQLFQFLVRQKRPLRFLHADFMLDERITQKPAVFDSDAYHLAQRHKINPDRVVAATVFRAQVHLEIVDERGSDLFQRDVAHMVSRFEKSFQVVVNGEVFLLGGLCPHPGLYHLVEIAVELIVNLH